MTDPERPANQPPSTPPRSSAAPYQQILDLLNEANRVANALAQEVLADPEGTVARNVDVWQISSAQAHLNQALQALGKQQRTLRTAENRTIAKSQGDIWLSYFRMLGDLLKPRAIGQEGSEESGQQDRASRPHCGKEPIRRCREALYGPRLSHGEQLSQPLGFAPWMHWWKRRLQRRLDDEKAALERDLAGS